MSRIVRYLQSLAVDMEMDVPAIVNYLVLDAVEARASDIHIEPWESTLAVRIRLDGVLTELVHLPLSVMDKISARLKVMANLVSYQVDVPQDGHVAAQPEFGGAELRISIIPTTRGEKIVLRIFDPTQRSFDLGTLGFEEDLLETFVRILSRPSGLILMTGPTGSGKTTTMYSALKHILHRAGPTLSVSTVEDPVEFNLPMVSQSQVNPLREYTYPVALRALLRQDPQVIMVGEVRDAETAGIALQAGLTGHLVISTVHSASSAGVFVRLMNMNFEPFLLASSIVGVIGIRLIRRNCTSCAAPYEPDSAGLRLLSEEFLADATFRRGSGCPDCLHTGFSGRFAIAEIMEVNAPLREAILQKLPERALHQAAIQQGMLTLWQAGLRRVRVGQTPLEEILRAVSVDAW